MARAGWAAAAIAMAAGLLGPGTAAEDRAYRDEIESWRRAREARLTADGGWLTVAGLFWLKEGENTFGSDAGNDFVLPRTAPARSGRFTLREGQVAVALEPSAAATIGGRPAAAGPLRSDASGEPDVVVMGRLSMAVIERGGRLAIRLRDLDRAERRAFEGLDWFPVDESYRVRARFEPYDRPKMIPVPNVLGTTEAMPSPGQAVFTRDGVEHRLDGVFETKDAQELFFIFGDATNGKETYAAGRFFYSALPEGGQVLLDFNKAYNPPCVFTPYATCPLPPKGNQLALRVTAGERRYGGH
jgi:uncharacterized protein (DUF1684 family)